MSGTMDVTTQAMYVRPNDTIRLKGRTYNVEVVKAYKSMEGVTINTFDISTPDKYYKKGYIGYDLSEVTTVVPCSHKPEWVVCTESTNANYCEQCDILLSSQDYPAGAKQP